MTTLCGTWPGAPTVREAPDIFLVLETPAGHSDWLPEKWAISSRSAASPPPNTTANACQARS